MGYACAVAAIGILVPFLVMIGMGRHLEGEAFEGLALGWWFGVPGAMLAGVVSSIVVFPFYRSCRSALTTSVLFQFNVLVIACLELFLMARFAGLLG